MLREPPGWLFLTATGTAIGAKPTAQRTVKTSQSSSAAQRLVIRATGPAESERLAEPQPDAECHGHEWLESVALDGLSAIDALRAATVGGAAALGRPELGRIAVGGPAVLVAVDGPPDQELAVLTRPGSIVGVWRGGALVT